jgi:predicted PurR-regulated permease PerM
MEVHHSGSLPLDARGRMVIRASFSVLLVAIAIWVSRDFIPAMAWAVVIVATIWPAYRWFLRLCSREGSNGLTALLFTALVGTVVFSPILLALHQLAEFREPAGQWIAQARDNGIPVPNWVAQAPIAGSYLSDLWRSQLADPQALPSLLAGFDTEQGGGWMQGLGGSLLHRAFLFAISLIVMFFLFRDGEWVANRVLDTADRLLGGPGESLARRMVMAVRGTVSGTVLVALVEGALIGVGYLLAGVPKPLVFALLTTAFAMLPFGAWIAFTVAAVALVAQGGSEVAAVCVFGWGAVVMLLGDHFLWPSLVSGAARLPFVPALIGIFGGLQTFGLVGLFVGPVVMAAVLTVWREWMAVPQG